MSIKRWMTGIMSVLLMTGSQSAQAQEQKPEPVKKEYLPADPIPQPLPMPEPETLSPLDVLNAHPPTPEDKAELPADAIPPAIDPETGMTEKSLHMHSLHTNETVDVVFWRRGAYVQEGLEEINRFLRDHRSGDIIEMDPELLSLVHRLYVDVGATGAIDIISGYRSPKTNAMLKSIGRNVATKSQHTLGKAMDVRFHGATIEKMRDTALKYKAGGVGYYPGSNFVHIDTGRPRQW
jgi:uncharacterized protein YcbK (DUF882 family)